MPKSTILDNKEYEVVIPFIDSELDSRHSKYGFNFNICIRAKKVDYKVNYNADIVKGSKYYKNLKKISINSKFDIVTSPCDGTIVYMEKSKYTDRYSISIYIDDSQVIVFDNLCFIFDGYEEGSKVFIGSKLGMYCVPMGNAKNVEPYLVFSYATNMPSKFPVRVWDMTYYKQDPTSVVEEIIEPTVESVVETIPANQGYEWDQSDLKHTTPEVGPQ